MGDINDDAERAFADAGIQANCRFVPYQGPFGGGHNVCDAVGDDRGEEFGAELIARQGGVDIYRTEVANSAALVAEREREWATIAAYNREQSAVAPVPTPYHPPATVAHVPQIADPILVHRVPEPMPFEAAPPPGTWSFDAQPAIINPNLGPAPPQTATPLQTAGPSLITLIDDLTGSSPITETLQQAVGGIPLWMLLVAAAAGAYMILGDKR